MNDVPDQVLDLLRRAEEEAILVVHPPDNIIGASTAPAWLQRVLAAASGFDDEWIDVDFRRPLVECNASGEVSPFREIGSLGMRGAAWLVEVTKDNEWSSIWYRSDDVYIFVARSLCEWLQLLIANRRYVKCVADTQAANSYFLLEDQLDKTAADIPCDNAHLPGIRQWAESAAGVARLSISGGGWRMADFRRDASARGFCVRGRRAMVPLEPNLFAVRGPRTPRLLQWIAAPFVWCGKSVVAGMFFWFIFLAVLSVVAVIVWAVRQIASLAG